MLNQAERTEARIFYEKLKTEVASLCKEANNSGDGNMQDGFNTRNLPDGWLSYKGMSCGMALETEPPAICVTFGPDAPFVGFKTTVVPNKIGDEVVWIEDLHNMQFREPKQLACHLIETLSEKVHDELPAELNSEAGK